MYPVIGKTYFQPDIYGSPLFASNEQGQVLRYAERNIWGDLKLPIHNDLNISGIQDSLRFTSYAYDPVIGKYFAQARFYDSRQGRMLSKDPVKRDINGYPYCNNDPVNCVDPTGEIANVLIGGAIGGLVGGAFGFANSTVSQLMSGKGFDSGKAWGAAANGAIVGAVKGAVAGSGVGLPLAIAADFTAGTLGSVAEQAISEGVVDAGKSIAGGLTNAVNGIIYGNGALQSLKEAAVKGAASGALTSGINYLADVTGPQPTARRSPGIQYQGGAAGMFRPRDPKRGCVPSDPSIGSLRYGRDYGYQYNVPASGEESQNRRGFSLCDFMKEMLTGAVTGGMAGATFYGAGRAVRALKESVRNLRNPKQMIPLDLQFFAEKDGKVYFGQKSVSPEFSKGGAFKGQSIQSISEKLSSGSLSPDDVPIEYIFRDGKMITINNRSLTALSKAELKPSKLIDVTGNVLEETRLTQRLNEMGGVPSESIFVRKIKEIVHIPN